jgi:anthrone oxygenase-like protein
MLAVATAAMENRMVRILRWISLLATAAPLGAAVAHILELPNKFALDGPLWLAVQQSLYRRWGPFIAPFEISAIAATWALAYMVRARRPAFRLTLTAALCLSAMLAVFFLFNAPVNAAFAGWTAETLPADWPEYRRQWELGHAIACVLALTAFCTLLRAAFVEASARRGAIERPASSLDRA